MTMTIFKVLYLCLSSNRLRMKSSYIFQYSPLRYLHQKLNYLKSAFLWVGTSLYNYVHLFLYLPKFTIKYLPFIKFQKLFVKVCQKFDRDSQRKGDASDRVLWYKEHIHPLIYLPETFKYLHSMNCTCSVIRLTVALGAWLIWRGWNTAVVCDVIICLNCYSMHTLWLAMSSSVWILMLSLCTSCQW